VDLRRSARPCAVGSERRLSEYGGDSGLRAIVRLLAAGHPVEDIEWVAEHVPTQRWWRDGGRSRGLASLSAEVVARELEARARAQFGRASCPSRARRIEQRPEQQRRANAFLRDAAASRCGEEMLRSLSSQQGPQELAVQLQRPAAGGELRNLPAAQSPALPRKLYGPDCMAALMSSINSPGPAKCRAADLGERSAVGK
jgi:hypothetical protein